MSDYTIKKSDYSEFNSVYEKCKNENEKFADFICYDNNSNGLNITERMGFKGRGLGKNEQRLRNPIESTVMPKYEGLVYGAGSGNINLSCIGWHNNM